MRIVVDTNALVDIHSCHDIVSTFDRRAAQSSPAAAIAQEDVNFRRARAREALLMALFFNNVGAKTYTLQSEALGFLARVAPPEAKGGTLLASDHMRFFAHFVMPELLPRWQAKFMQPKSAEWPSGLRYGERARLDRDLCRPVGNDADLFYIAYARLKGLDLVTCEGFTKDGYGTSQISQWATDEGVRMLFPRDVYSGRINEDYVAERFLARFAEKAPAFLEGRRRVFGDADRGGEFLEYLGGYYEHLLFGRVHERTDPVPVSIAPR